MGPLGGEPLISAHRVPILVKHPTSRLLNADGEEHHSEVNFLEQFQ
jgi:hypothetical protein